MFSHERDKISNRPGSWNPENKIIHNTGRESISQFIKYKLYFISKINN